MTNNELLAGVEPVGAVQREPDYWTRGHFCEGRRNELVIRNTALPAGTKVYAEGDVLRLLEQARGLS